MSRHPLAIDPHQYPRLIVRMLKDWQPKAYHYGQAPVYTTSSMNALKHGMRSAEMRAMESGLALMAKLNRDFLKFED